MRELLQVFHSKSVSRVDVIVHDVDTLVESVEWKNNKEFFPLICCQLIADEWDKEAENSANH